MVKANANVVIAEGLAKRFGDFPAVAGIDFEVHRGEIFGFLGPNGSGKTTTIRMMLGLLQPSAGRVEVLGVDVGENPAAIRPRIGYMSQQFSLYNDLTVLENLRFYGRAYGLANHEMGARIEEAIARAGLAEHENAKTVDLSGGWRQRLALSAAILHQPELIFLDEPTAGVDPVSRRDFWDLLYDLADGGTSIFVTTHYMDEAEHSHRLAFIQRGEIIATGTPKQMKAQAMDGEVLELAVDNPVKATEVLQAIQASGELPILEVALYGKLIHAVALQIEAMLPQIKSKLEGAGVAVQGMTVIEPSLEDVFISSMERAKASLEGEQN